MVVVLLVLCFATINAHLSCQADMRVDKGCNTFTMNIVHLEYVCGANEEAFPRYTKTIPSLAVLLNINTKLQQPPNASVPGRPPNAALLKAYVS